MSPAPPFRYEGYRLDPAQNMLTCHYSLGERRFAERVGFPGGGNWAAPAADAAARLVFLLAGVSYYKTAAPNVIDLGGTAVTDAERAFLAGFYLDGLGEFAYRNGLDLSGLRIEGRSARSGDQGGPAAASRRSARSGDRGVRGVAPPGQHGRWSRSAAASTRSSRLSWSGSTPRQRCSLSAVLGTGSRPSRRPPRSPGCPLCGPSVRSTVSCSAPLSLASLTATCR